MSGAEHMARTVIGGPASFTQVVSKTARQTELFKVI